MAVLPFKVLHPVVALRHCIIAHNYQPISIYNWDARCDSPGKKPFDLGWPQAKGIPRWSEQATNTGVVTNNLRAIDVDIDDAEAAKTAVALAEQSIGRTLVRFRDNSPRRLLLYRGSGKKLVIKTAKGKVEILGEGQQFV